MAQELFKGMDIEFADGESRFVKPLTIKQLKKFVKLVKDLDTDLSSITDEDIEKMVDAAEVVLEKVDPKLAADRDKLEDAINVVTFGYIFQVAMGNDPNA